MRQTNDKNQIWFERQDQVTRIGFTQDFLTSLDQCWHILPANLDKFREQSPLLTIETNDALISIVSPVKGSFMEFSAKAQNFPNKLTADDVVMQISDAPVVREQPRAMAGIDELLRQQVGINQQAMAIPAAPRPRRPFVPEPAIVWGEPQPPVQEDRADVRVGDLNAAGFNAGIGRRGR